MTPGDAPPPHFSGTDVEFPDGTTVTDPHQDALGYVYKDTESWIAGEDKHELADDSSDSGTTRTTES